MTQVGSTVDAGATPAGVALTLSEAAEACGVHRATVRRYLDRGQLPGAFKAADGAWRVPVPALLNAGLRLRVPDAPPPDDELTRLAAENALLRERLARAEATAEERERHLATALSALRMLPAVTPRRRWFRRAAGDRPTTPSG
jgi:hypothetical protein